jgi:anti-anti-sigma factor
LRLGVRRLALAFWLLVRDHGWLSRGKGRAVPAGPSVMVVKLPTEMNIANAADVRAELLTAVESGAAVVIADMTGTTFTDTMAIRALVLAHQHAAAAGAELRLALSSRLVLHVLSAMGFDGYFSVYPTVAQAQAAGTAAGEPRAR